MELAVDGLNKLSGNQNISINFGSSYFTVNQPKDNKQNLRMNWWLNKDRPNDVT